MSAPTLDNYHFRIIGDHGTAVRQRDVCCVDDFQAEAMVRILLLSPGTRLVEAWFDGRVLYRSER